MADVNAVAWAVYAKSHEYPEPVLLPDYTGSMDVIRRRVMEGARREGFKGDFVERMAELGWWVEPLVLATNYEALRKRCEAVEAALQKVADWELPETGEFWPSGVKVSYEANWGSSGVRDYFRHLARQAIAAAQEPSHG